MKKPSSILIKNIYYMLSYAFTTLRQSTYERVAAEEFNQIHNLFAAILSKGIGRQLKQGLYREYISRLANTAVVRGKIDMPGTVQRLVSHQRVLSCVFDELSENNLLNQILKTTVGLLLRHRDVELTHKNALKQAMLYFSGVDLLDAASIPWSSLQFQRNNQTYQMLIYICYLLLQGMLITTEDGMHRMAGFEDERELSSLYERFVLEYYRSEHPELNPRSAQIRWALDDGFSSMLPMMQSDIMLSKGKRTLIIDTKCYARTMQVHYDKRTHHSANLYQIFTYVKNKSAELADGDHELSGMLLYARTRESVQPDHVYWMSGNRISVKTLDLNQEFSKIKAQLDAIALDHFGAVG